MATALDQLMDMTAKRLSLVNIPAAGTLPVATGVSRTYEDLPLGSEGQFLSIVGGQLAWQTVGPGAGVWTQSGNYAKYTSPFGYVMIGPGNTSYCHHFTDLPRNYFDKPLTVAGGRFEAYGTGDLTLVPGHNSPVHRGTVIANNLGEMIVYTGDATTPFGWIKIGALNTGAAHFYTDRNCFYFSKYLLVAGNVEPYTDSLTLGSGTRPWLHLYVKNAIIQGELGYIRIKTKQMSLETYVSYVDVPSDVMPTSSGVFLLLAAKSGGDDRKDTFAIVAMDTAGLMETSGLNTILSGEAVLRVSGNRLQARAASSGLMGSFYFSWTRIGA